LSNRNVLSKLAGQTAIYGLSSIVGRLLNYLLTPLLTRVYSEGEYGVITEWYSYSGFLLVLFVYGMETAFFRYIRQAQDMERVYSTVMLSLLASTALFVGILTGFSGHLSDLINYPQHPEYLIWFAFIIGLDTLSAIPFARLRYQEKAFRFAGIKLVNIGVNIGLTLFFLLLCPVWAEKYAFIGVWYQPEIEVGYVFLANLIAGIVTLLLLMPEWLKIRFRFDYQLWKSMMVYALPLVVVGFAGIVNEMLDRVILKYLLPYDPDTNQSMLGIYGACYKLSILMSLFTQAYRFAAEPLFFAQAAREDAPKLYAASMKYFVIAGTLIFIGVMLFMDIFERFIGEPFRVGLAVVPFLLMANLMLGIYYNLSIWYKLSNKTQIGAYISLLGAAITILLNMLLIPYFGYMGAAWATLACYTIMVIVSFIAGQKHYPIPYESLKLTGYIWLGILAVLTNAFWVNDLPVIPAYAFRIALILAYLLCIYRIEKLGRVFSR